MRSNNQLIRVFYYNAKKNHEVPSDTPQQMTIDEVLILSKEILLIPNSFIGLIDATERTFQLTVFDDLSVWVEIPEPELSGSSGKYITYDELDEIFANLTIPFDKADFPDFEFSRWG